MVAAVVTGQGVPPAERDFWAALVWLVVLASLGGYVMYVFVARSAGATVVSTLLYLTPPTTMLWVFLMFGQPITLVGLLGLVVSLVGVLIVMRGRRTAAAAAAADTGAAPAPSGAAQRSRVG
jgi:drug/metabolite transporter (DMT)-like permease